MEPKQPTLDFEIGTHFSERRVNLLRLIYTGMERRLAKEIKPHWRLGLRRGGGPPSLWLRLRNHDRVMARLSSAAKTGPAGFN